MKLILEGDGPNTFVLVMGKSQGKERLFEFRLECDEVSKEERKINEF